MCVCAVTRSTRVGIMCVTTYDLRRRHDNRTGVKIIRNGKTIFAFIYLIYTYIIIILLRFSTAPHVLLTWRGRL